MSLFGWTLCALGVFALLALLITSGDIRDHTAGTGERRITRRGQLAAQRKRIADLEQQIACCPTCTPQELGFPTVEEIAASDRSDPAPRMAMPAGIGAGSSVRAAETVRDGFLDSIARPGEEQMLAGLKAMQNAPLKAAAPEAVTVTLPAVTAVLPRIPDRAPEGNPLDIPAPHPMASATAVPAGFPDLAHDKVTAALEEAS